MARTVATSEAPPASRTTVRLLHVPDKRQGTHDSLCAYYAAAMVVTALQPELEDQFEAAHVNADPLFGHYPRRRHERVDRIVARWLAAGVHLDRLCAAMNRSCRNLTSVRTRFVYEKKRRARTTLDCLRVSVDAGLPCVLGWESREMGLHTVCVVGYERYRGGGDWLRVHDPARLQDALEWSQLLRLARRLEVILCAEHTGVRPDRLTSCRNADGKIVASRIDRFGPQGWSRLSPSPDP